MIKDQWYLVLDAKELKKNNVVGTTRLSEKLVFWRDENDEVNCIFDQCCHRGASLSAGKVVENLVECPFHGFQYDSKGRVVTIPANGKKNRVPSNFKVNSYLVKEAYGFVWLWYSEDQSSAPEIPFFEELQSGFSYGGFSEVWPVHYTRAVENQLDVVHLPFVHQTTIGSDNRTVVNGPVIKWTKNRMTIYVSNAGEHGQIPKRPEEIADVEGLFSLQFQMPNLWQNRISKQVRIFAGFAPIDEEHTRIYLRFYQSFVKLPILRGMVNRASNVFNRIILHQDRRVVLTQWPKKSELKMKENLIQGDLPIVEFRKKREELKRISNGQ